ncbi:MAG: DUF2277 domain-containing protein [Nocardioides sp.]|nr:DUF2277 domain-containing protein [Nocardioides sp.]
MCRNIRPLNNFEPPATRDEVAAAALQYVRKVSGTTKPSQANQAAFDRAVREIAHVTPPPSTCSPRVPWSCSPAPGSRPTRGSPTTAVRARRRGPR